MSSQQREDSLVCRSSHAELQFPVSESTGVADEVNAAPVQTNSIKTNLPESFVKLAFKQFLEERMTHKRSIYFKVSIAGVVVAAVSYTLFLLLTLVVNAEAPVMSSYSVPYNIVALLSTFMRVVGLCMCSVVPTDELDFLEILLRKKIYLHRLSIASCIAMMVAAAYVIVTMCIPYTAKQKTLRQLQLFATVIVFVAPFLIVGIWHLLSLRDGLTYQQIQRKYKYTLLLVPYTLSISLGLGSVYLLYTNDDTGHSPTLYDALSSAALVAPFGCVLIYQLVIDNALLINRYVQYDLVKPEDESEKGGKGMKALYMLLYRICVAVTVCFWIEAPNSFIAYPWQDAMGWVQIGLGWSDILPILVALYLGQRRCFSLVARYFEYDVSRQRMDGCFMVLLVKSCQEFPVDETGAKLFWFHRKTDDEWFPVVSGKINRRRWLIGKLKTTTDQPVEHDVRVVARYRDDCDATAVFAFKQALLERSIEPVTVSLNTDNSVSSLSNRCSFDEWYKNIEPCTTGKYSVFRVDEIQAASFRIVLDKALSEEELSRIKLGMSSKFDLTTLPAILEPLKGEIEYVRQFETKYFESEAYFLLGQSPRDASGEDVGYRNSRLLSFSTPIKIRNNGDKIDFFLSHSWNDSANKIESLNWFIRKFQHENGRFPTLWFDRVCIDQNNVTDGISLLPIHIGACNSMLILMGKTYMTRLWCIWELFMLFTFCNKDLALERIQVLCLEEDFDPIEAIRNFDINAAHCYDPNEEFRLRYLMLEVVGAEALKTSIQSMEQLHQMGRIIYLDEIQRKRPNNDSCCDLYQRLYDGLLGKIKHISNKNLFGRSSRTTYLSEDGAASQRRGDYVLSETELA